MLQSIAGLVLSSRFYIHRHAGLEFYSEFVLVDGDFFNQSPDKSLVIINQGSGLLM